MGKIFKALEKSQQQFDLPQENEETAQPDPEPEVQPGEPVSSSAPAVDISNVTLDPTLVTGLDPQSVEAEQFRLLKNAILFPEKGQPHRCIMITSASPGEGKSFVAANLAISISQNIDEHVLLVDCDLRSPSIHGMFGLDAPMGLSEYLSNSVPLSSLLVRSYLDKLTILPAGQIPPNPSELLSSDQMKQLIKEVKSRYSDRYIIIDTPPPYLTSEANAISRQVDGIIIVVQHGNTQKKDVMDLLDIYGREKIMGVVYNFASSPFGSRYGKYGYGRYGYGVKNA